MATDTVDIGTLIVSDPAFRNGMPCIAGTGMSVLEVAARYQRGQTAEFLAKDVPDIPLSHFHAAIAFYLANQERFDRELKEEEREGERLYREWLAEQ